MSDMPLRKLSDYLWEIPRSGRMRVPARIYTSEKMLAAVRSDNAPQQAANVACLPGIVNASLAMPDMHWGYGFPIGGVAAFDMDEGVISPGGVGYDINCGVRLMASSLSRQDVLPRLREVVTQLFKAIPTGVGSTGTVRVGERELRRTVVQGAQWAVHKGFGSESDLNHIEEQGCMQAADPDRVSDHAVKRGLPQLGTLGSGNHFVEVGYVAEVYDAHAADVLGLFADQLTIIVHCGSRGYGHQVCDDYLGTMDRAGRKYGIELPDRQLACAPIGSEEGQAYLGAMRCAVNYAFANRQIISHGVREALQNALGASPRDLGLRTVYEVAHNIAKIENHTVDGKDRELCVHRKGATRAFGAGHPAVPEDYRRIGQPVLVPGDMGRYSYVLLGTEVARENTFGSTCHGAGRIMSRRRAKSAGRGRDIVGELARKGIVIMGQSHQTIVEEMPDAYKDVADVVDACVGAGICRRVARLQPLGVIKG